MTKPSDSPRPASKSAPLVKKSLTKPGQKAAGLLGRSGAGASLSVAPRQALPTVAPTDTTKPEKAARAGHNVPTDLGGPAGGHKHPGKPEARRPTGRAISGG